MGPASHADGWDQHTRCCPIKGRQVVRGRHVPKMIPSRSLLGQHLGLAVSLQALRGFPDSSVGKESACNAGDPGLILGWRRSTGEWIDYPLQYSWASIVAQLVKNLPEMQETWIPSLGWEDALEKGKATHSRILAWRIPWTV